MSSEWNFLGAAIMSILGGLLLFGCRSAEPTANKVLSEPGCEEPGTVVDGTMEETSRGYGYKYAIYLPPCYETDREALYPVLYLLPGLGSGPRSWFAAGVNDVVDDLIISGQVPPFLIVGTEVTSSDPLAETIYNDLIPYIENNYRVKPGRQHRSVAGGSLGSIGAYRLAFQHPDQFATAGMFGGGLVGGEEPRVQEWFDAMPGESRPRVFLNTGEQDPLMLQGAQEMIDILDEKQIEHAEVFTPGGHTYAYWVSNFPAYLEWLAEDWE